MSAPSGTKWGSIVGGDGRIGIYLGVSSTATQTRVNVQVWFWSKWSVRDSSNKYYFNNNATSATTLIGSIPISHSVASGAGWSTKNQTKLGESTYTYNRGTSAYSRSCAAKFSGIETVGGTMYAVNSYTVPALARYTISYNANGGKGAPPSQTKYYGIGLRLSNVKPTRIGYTFKGWSITGANGAVYYQPGNTCGRNENLTLYAIWERIVYNIEFDANTNGGYMLQGSEQVEQVSVQRYYDQTLGTLPIAYKKSNKFIGWNTLQDGTGLMVSDETRVHSSITLYAIFSLQANCYIKDGGTYKAGMLYQKVDGVYKTGMLSVKDGGEYKQSNME